ncbi:hypothetical protein Rhe02_33640 [Rhizocola hellebori]|uniref:Trypsin-co-occurring domain-containing protein n=1 Tax=Rhizocola hellebori TaxID=1392758 RepID=A0A8J3Q8J2_9ACTN|nr:trypco2 family protein [Rhizocola hellebori]GIH05297.1 hypothetical protein Rhe02_33640 [Rhizocola hellebori]
MSDDALTLADLIYQLRGDLNLAAWQGRDKDPKFVVGPIELEVSVVVDTSRSGGVAAKLVLVDASAGATRTSQTVHRIRLTLQPIGPDGRSPHISGEPMPGEE